MIRGHVGTFYVLKIRSSPVSIIYSLFYHNKIWFYGIFLVHVSLFKLPDDKIHRNGSFRRYRHNLVSRLSPLRYSVHS